MSIEAIKQALEFIDSVKVHPSQIASRDALHDTLRTAIAQAEKQEPVAWQGVHDKTDLYYRKPPQADVRPLYITPQPQEFVCSNGFCRFTLTQTGVGIGERGMQAYEEAKKRGWVGISDELESPQPSEQGVSDETGRHDRNA